MAQTSTPWKQMRETTGLSLREVARRTGINPGVLSVIERGLTPQQESALRRVLFEAIEARS